MRIHDTKPEKLEGAMLVVGFPSRGLVGAIAASYIVQELSMWPVAAVFDDAFPPAVSVRGGVAVPPVQLYVSAERCGPDGRCDKLVVLNAEIPIEPAQSHALAAAVLDWAKAQGISHVVTVEGIDFDTEDDRPLFAVAGPANKDLTMAAFSAEPLPDGTISSHTSTFLLAAIERGMEIVGLLVGADEEADEAAAAESLVRIDPVVPHLNLSAKEFRAKVTKVRSSRNTSDQAAARQLQGMRKVSEMMYQ